MIWKNAEHGKKGVIEINYSCLISERLATMPIECEQLVVSVCVCTHQKC